MLYCVLKLCTVICTPRWAVFTVLWIGFLSHWAHFTVCIFFCVYLCVFCVFFSLHICCVIVSAVGWIWWNWNLILRTYLSSVLWHCWLGHLTVKTRPRYDLYNVCWDVKPYSTSTLLFLLKMLYLLNCSGCACTCHLPTHFMKQCIWKAKCFESFTGRTSEFFDRLCVFLSS